MRAGAPPARRTRTRGAGNAPQRWYSHRARAGGSGAAIAGGRKGAGVGAEQELWLQSHIPEQTRSPLPFARSRCPGSSTSHPPAPCRPPLFLLSAKARISGGVCLEQAEPRVPAEPSPTAAPCWDGGQAVGHESEFQRCP